MYSNQFTRPNPGLIIFLVDQSGSTEDIMLSNNRSIAENIADLVNVSITEAIDTATAQISDEEEKVKREVCFAVVGYGGKGNPEDPEDKRNWQAELLMQPKYSDTIYGEYQKERSTISNLDIFQILSPVHGGGTPMASAYKTALDILTRWLPTHDSDKDPVPVIINISDGEPTDSVDDIKETISKINELKIADGSPIIINLHLSAKNSQELKTPSNIDDCVDEYAKLMYEISTEVTDDLANNCKPIKSLGISKGAKLFCSNIQDPKFAARFLAIGTPVKKML